MNWKQTALSFGAGVLGVAAVLTVRTMVADHYLLGQLVSAWNDEHRPHAAQPEPSPTTKPTK